LFFGVEVFGGRDSTGWHFLGIGGVDGDTQDYPAQPAFEIVAASVVQAGSNPARSKGCGKAQMQTGIKDSGLTAGETALFKQQT